MSFAAVFPGQGSQYVGMAKDLYENFKIAREAFEEASDFSKLNLKRLCFDGPESDLTLTEHTQPSLLTASVAAFRVAQTEAGFMPAIVAGHSLGEYSALVAAGSLSLGRAAAWVRERGAAMQKAVPPGEGSMAAILGLEDFVAEKLCHAASEAAKKKRQLDETSHLSVEAIVQPANYNAPNQVVIAGSSDAVNEALTLLKTGTDFPGGKAIPLQVSAPFHCKLMAPARDRMAELFSQVSSEDRPKTLSCPYIPNRTARITRETGLVFELLVEQVDHPVLWKQSVLALIETGVSQGFEFGPGKVLQGLAKRIAQQAGKPLSFNGVNDSQSVRAMEGILRVGEKSA